MNQEDEEQGLKKLLQCFSSVFQWVYESVCKKQQMMKNLGVLEEDEDEE